MAGRPQPVSRYPDKVVKTARQLDSAAERLCLAGSQRIARHISNAYRQRTGGDGVLSGMNRSRRGTGRRAPAIKAYVKDVAEFDGVQVGLVKPSGPWALIERDVPPHAIAPFRQGDRSRFVKRARGKARRKGESAVLAARLARAQYDAFAGQQAKALKIGGNFRRAVNHPGTKARPTFQPAARAAGPDAAKGAAEQMRREAVKAYKA